MNAITGIDACTAVVRDPRSSGVRQRRHLDLWDLLVWAYRHQLVGGAYAGRGMLLHDREPSNCSTDGVAAMQRWAELDCWIDGGEWAGLTDRMHPDAQEVASAVHRLGERFGWQDASLIAYTARNDERPEPSTARPHPVKVPMTGPGSYDPVSGKVRPKVTQPGDDLPAELIRDAWAGWHPVPTDAELVRLKRRHPGSTIRRREKGFHYGRDAWEGWVWSAYCPVVYWPDLAFITATNATYARWHRAMVALLADLQGVSLRDHVVTGFDAIPPETGA